MSTAMKPFVDVLALSPYSSFSQWQKHSGIPRGTFWKIVNGQCTPTVSTAIRMARTAGTTVENLFNYTIPQEEAPTHG